eukprot:270324_1
MGACCSMQPDDNTKQIDNILHREQQDEKAVIKLLFLGPGGSGKSTIFKQLQFLHGNGFTESDARFLREVIYTQIISQMQCIIKYYKLQDDESNDEPLQNAISTVLKHDEMRSFNTELADSVQYIWTHAEQITHAFSDTEVAKTQMLDETTEYFWNDLDRIKDANYFPKEKDIIYVRFRTTGVIQKRFGIKNEFFEIFDVGGQKSERKKWVTCFNEVNAVVFVISLACYNETMYEDQHTNAMADAMQLFEETVNNKYFNDTHVILFLNKTDLFKKKITKFGITECCAFSDYTQDPNDYHQTTEYIQQTFEALDHSQTRDDIYCHLTCAMSKQNIDNVFCDIAQMLMNQALGELGLGIV